MGAEKTDGDGVVEVDRASGVGHLGALTGGAASVPISIGVVVVLIAAGEVECGADPADPDGGFPTLVHLWALRADPWECVRLSTWALPAPGDRRGGRVLPVDLRVVRAPAVPVAPEAPEEKATPFRTSWRRATSGWKTPPERESPTITTSRPAKLRGQSRKM